MAVAIKLSFAEESYSVAVERYKAQGRRGIVVSCSICDARYFLFFGPEMEEEEARQWFYYQSRRDHPHPRCGFSAREQFPAPVMFDEPVERTA